MAAYLLIGLSYASWRGFGAIEEQGWLVVTCGKYVLEIIEIQDLKWE